jgi:hypothetical protein
MKIFPRIGIQIPTTYLPNDRIDLSKWAVIACDQYTSQPEYWEQAAKYVGNAPSTLHLILPEVYLGTAVETQRVSEAQSKMKQYLADGTLLPQDHIIYVERTVDGKTRRGLMLALDLEKYDFSVGSQSLIRATEGTILDRLPPRIRIRKDATIELPHILVLIDDPEDKVIGPIEQNKDSLPVAYNFDLMQNSGHLCGRLVTDSIMESAVISNIESLADPKVFHAKYGVSSEKGVLLFAVGDGNHSLATAKAIWEQIKPGVGMDHPARYALVEIENIHDNGLQFEPIHRVLFHLTSDAVDALRSHFKANLKLTPAVDFAHMKAEVDQKTTGVHRFGVITTAGVYVAALQNPAANLPVGSLQPFLDQWMKAGGASSIDYVHGDETVMKLGSQAGNVGFYLPAMEKSELFRTVILDGALPRKTFSMGEAHEKRFYMEARKITP